MPRPPPSKSSAVNKAAPTAASYLPSPPQETEKRPNATTGASTDGGADGATTSVSLRRPAPKREAADNARPSAKGNPEVAALGAQPPSKQTAVVARVPASKPAPKRTPAVAVPAAASSSALGNDTPDQRAPPKEAERLSFATRTAGPTGAASTTIGAASEYEAHHANTGTGGVPDDTGIDGDSPASERKAAKTSVEENTVSSNDGEHTNTVMAPSRVSIARPQPNMPGPWGVIGRVISRGSIREWSNLRSIGKRLELSVADGQGETVKATLFNDGVDKFFETVAPGSVCRFRNGRVKADTRAFSSDRVELTFDRKSKITTCSGDEEAVPASNAGCIGVSALSSVKPKSRVSILSVVVNVEASKRITTSKGKTCLKRDFLVVDDSMHKIICTAWGYLAREPIDGCQGKLVILRQCEVVDYNGERGLNVGVGSSIIVDPSLPRGDCLREWYQTMPSVAECATVRGSQ